VDNHSKLIFIKDRILREVDILSDEVRGVLHAHAVGHEKVRRVLIKGDQKGDITDDSDDDELFLNESFRPQLERYIALAEKIEHIKSQERVAVQDCKRIAEKRKTEHEAECKRLTEALRSAENRHLQKMEEFQRLNAAREEPEQSYSVLSGLCCAQRPQRRNGAPAPKSTFEPPVVTIVEPPASGGDAAPDGIASSSASPPSS